MKHFFLSLLAGVFLMAGCGFTAILALDAYEFERTGDCRYCVVLDTLRPSLAYEAKPASATANQ